MRYASWDQSKHPHLLMRWLHCSNSKILQPSPATICMYTHNMWSAVMTISKSSIFSYYTVDVLGWFTYNSTERRFLPFRPSLLVLRKCPRNVWNIQLHSTRHSKTLDVSWHCTHCNFNNKSIWLNEKEIHMIEGFEALECNYCCLTN